ncbi:hypothetical protein N658DRAFT_498778 [Parathielavia hyrcaniae]|uniref:Uncharacterized protein n=1 Tax=Parathielavia hyrcaniae TaxID=113614 RepID=A0AAN6SZH6_9PEZI|nr:hypothetical protein N658DRAFT_498778 [Parathielavia hyrcaniae]
MLCNSALSEFPSSTVYVHSSFSWVILSFFDGTDTLEANRVETANASGMSPSPAVLEQLINSHRHEQV